MLAALELPELLGDLVDDPAASDSEPGTAGRPGEEKTRVVKPKR
jgi:hypothetical protein